MKGIKVLISFLIAASAASASAQVLDVSPYSWFGLGTQTSGVSPAQALHGGGSAAYRSPLYFNPVQPAALGRLKYTTFDLSGSYQGLVYQNSDTSLTTSTGGFQQVNLAFPLAKGLAASAGLQPYSTVGYQLSSVVTLPDFGVAKYTYTGNGGLTQANLGIGWSPVKYFSVGLRGAYHFGSVKKTTLLDFGDPRFLNIGSREETVYRGWQATAGAQAALPLGKWLDLELGTTQALRANLTGAQTALQYSLLNNGSAVPTYRDTAWSVIDTPGMAQLPADQRYGFRLVRRAPGSNLDAWTLAMEIQRTRTQDASSFYPNGGFPVYRYAAESRTWRVGATLVPALAFPQGSWKNGPANWVYATGISQARTGLVLNQETLTRWVGSTGVTIPLGTRSFVPGDVKFAALHLGVQWETYGTAKAGLVREDHLRAVFGLTLNDQWFQKFKYR